jgi:tyrosyl-tRNA synthetase
VESGLASSSSEAKRFINEGAVKLSEQPISDANLVLVAEGDEKGKELGVLQLGRRKFRMLYSG